jgi:hypothetical protein
MIERIVNKLKQLRRIYFPTPEEQLQDFLKKFKELFKFKPR